MNDGKALSGSPPHALDRRPKGHQMTVAEFIIGIAPHLWIDKHGNVQKELSGGFPWWPPDVFAMVAFLLQQTGAYMRVSFDWPPHDAFEIIDGKEFTSGDWKKEIRKVGHQWRTCCNKFLEKIPSVECKLWNDTYGGLSSTDIPPPKDVGRWWANVEKLGAKTPIEFLCVDWAFKEQVRNSFPEL